MSQYKQIQLYLSWVILKEEYFLEFEQLDTFIEEENLTQTYNKW